MLKQTLINTPSDKIFNTGYQHFTTKYGIAGLIKQSTDRIDFLAFRSDCPGKGNFKKFLTALKTEYKQIYIWELVNERFKKMLLTEGFVPCSEVSFDCVLKGVSFTDEN